MKERDLLFLNFIKHFKRGHTLMEMVISIIVFSLFLMAAFLVFSFGLKTWKLIETKSDAQMQAELAMDRIINDLKSTDISSLVMGTSEEMYIVFETAWSDPSVPNPEFHKLGGYPEWQGYLLYYTCPDDTSTSEKKLLRKFVPHTPDTTAREMTDIHLYLVDTFNPGEDLRVVARNIYNLEFNSGINNFTVDIRLVTKKSFSEKRLAYEKDFSDNVAIDFVTLTASVVPRNTP